MFDTLVTVEVGTGDTQRTFEVFKGLLSFYFGYLDSALNGHFHEASERTVKLPSEEPLIFDLFRYWIHTRRFYPSTLEPSVLLDYDALAKLWVFGDAHLVPLLQNTVIEILAEKILDTLTAPEEEVIGFIYENTVPDSPLRFTIITSLKAMMSTPEDLHEEVVPWGPPLFADGAEVTKRAVWSTELRKPGGVARRTWLRGDRCRRHVHEEGVCCEKVDWVSDLLDALRRGNA